MSAKKPKKAYARSAFNRRLGRLLEEQGLTRYELAARCPDVSRTTVYQLVSGAQQEPGFGIACQLADALGVPLDAFRP